MKAKVTELVKNASVIESRGTNDTVRLWESYREQATLWRAIGLIQSPITFLSLILALIMYFNHQTILNVPAKPLPGIYQVQDIPDSEFVDAATNFVNLTWTYTPSNARRQYTRARELIVNPLMARFDVDFMQTELKTIENTGRAQVFFVDPALIRIERQGSFVNVVMMGDRMKVVAGKELEPSGTKYTITMQTVPRNDINPYGIVVRDIASESLKPGFERAANHA